LNLILIIGIGIITDKKLPTWGSQSLRSLH
jgi:hypothetical protein